MNGATRTLTLVETRLSEEEWRRTVGREHVASGGKLYTCSPGGHVAHILHGWNGSRGRCGNLGAQIHTRLPDGMRECKRCVRAHDKAHAEEMRVERNNALSGGMRLQAQRERCRRCRLAQPHSDDTCVDAPLRAEWQAFRELVQEARTPREVWEAYRLFYYLHD